MVVVEANPEPAREGKPEVEAGEITSWWWSFTWLSGTGYWGNGGLSCQADRTAVFDALTPLLAVEDWRGKSAAECCRNVLASRGLGLCLQALPLQEYRPSLLLGLVVSVGGITEHTAKDSAICQTGSVGKLEASSGNI